MAELVQADRDVRVPRVPHPDVARQDADRHREHGRDLELAQLERQRRASALPAALDRAHSRPRLGQEAPPGRRQRDAAREPVEDRAVQLELERLDVLRQRRLRDPDATRRAGERAFVDDRDEALELTEVHSRNLSHRVPTLGLDLWSATRRDSPRACGRDQSRQHLGEQTSRSRPGSTRSCSGWSASRRRSSTHPCSGCASATCSSTSSSTRAARAPSRHHLGLTIDDFEAAYEAIRARTDAEWGAQLVELPSGQVQLYFRDPSGNLIELNWADASTLDRSRYPELRVLARAHPADAGVGARGPLPRPESRLTASAPMVGSVSRRARTLAVRARALKSASA